MGTWGNDISTGHFAWSPVMEAMQGLEPGTFAGTFDAFIRCVPPRIGMLS
jgi:hypothetical protein